MRRLIVFFLCVFCLFPSLANECIEYKKDPAVNITSPEWERTIVQSDKELDLALHGHVMANMVMGNSIKVEVLFIKKGFCVSVSDVDLIFGYNDFQVEIDKNYYPDSCAYNAVMKHEQKHINAYLSVMDDYKDELKNAAVLAANSIMPVLVKSKSEIDNVIEKFNEEFQKHPELILVKQKIMTEQEIRNKKIDQQEDGSDLMKCFE